MILSNKIADDVELENAIINHPAHCTRKVDRSLQSLNDIVHALCIAYAISLRKWSLMWRLESRFETCRKRPNTNLSQLIYLNATQWCCVHAPNAIQLTPGRQTSVNRNTRDFSSHLLHWRFCASMVVSVSVTCDVTTLASFELSQRLHRSSLYLRKKERLAASSERKPPQFFLNI